MRTAYTYDGVVADPSKLGGEIADSSITIALAAIEVIGLVLTVWFKAELSAEEKQILDGLVSDHDPTPVDVAEPTLADLLPKSDIDGTKLAVHSSPKPTVPGTAIYVIWTGCGDDIRKGEMGSGELLQFQADPLIPEKSIRVEFLPSAGRVWVHEGYLKFTGAGLGDYISAEICSNATPLQTAANLDLVVVDNWIRLSSDGLGTGTHGWADSTKIALVPRTFSKDGDWDYDPENGLRPNLGATGSYKISDIERTVHRYINRVPCFGSVTNYFTMSSDETAELPTNYFLNITQFNVSGTVWSASVIVEIYRERTHDP